MLDECWLVLTRIASAGDFEVGGDMGITPCLFGFGVQPMRVVLGFDPLRPTYAVSVRQRGDNRTPSFTLFGARAYRNQAMSC